MNLPVPSGTTVPSSKYLDLARRIKEIELENAKLSMKLEKSNQHLFRLRLERSVLMEKLTSIEPKIKVPAGSAALKEEILKEMDAVNDTEEPGEEDEGN